MLKGAFIRLSQNKDGLELFTFMQVESSKIKEYLNYKDFEINKNHDTLYLIFYDGINEKGSGTLDEILNITKSLDRPMINLLTNSYDEIIKTMPNLNIEIYKSIYNFATYILGVKSNFEEENTNVNLSNPYSIHPVKKLFKR
tara:strand:- start:24 stop:449 length:426 start_codon:yes stop_codon:yes gene_type:complete